MGRNCSSQRRRDIAGRPIIHSTRHPAQTAAARCANPSIVERQHRRAALGEIACETAVNSRGNSCTAYDDDNRRRRYARGLEPQPHEWYAIIPYERDGTLVEPHGEITYPNLSRFQA